MIYSHNFMLWCLLLEVLLLLIQFRLYVLYDLRVVTPSAIAIFQQVRYDRFSVHNRFCLYLDNCVYISSLLLWCPCPVTYFGGNNCDIFFYTLLPSWSLLVYSVNNIVMTIYTLQYSLVSLKIFFVTYIFLRVLHKHEFV